MKRKLISRITAFAAAALMSASVLTGVSASAFNFTPISGFDEDNKAIEVQLRSEAAYMINMDTGEVVIDINSNEQRVPASLTKIMTALVLLDEFEGDEEKLKSTRYSAGSEAFDELYGTGASTADIQPNEAVSCYDLLCALMLPSACEAANIIAYSMCGSVEAFAERMNAKAEEIGMDDSHFSNAHGLSGDNNYSTCADIAKMCMYALDNYPVFTQIVSMNDYTLAPTEFHPDGTYIYSTNYMLNPNSMYYYSYCCGIKTGTLDAAGRCLASYAVCDGMRYMTVTMGAPLYKSDEDYAKGNENPNSVYADDTVYFNLIDHINLYEWAFDYLEVTEFVDKNSELREAKIEYGENGRDYVALKPETDFSLCYPSYMELDSVTQEIEVYDNIVAPVYQGDELGMLTVKFNGEVVSEIPLVATESVNRSKPAEKVEIAKAFPRSNEFRISISLIVIFVVIFVIAHVVRIQNKYRKR